MCTSTANPGGLLLIISQIRSRHGECGAFLANFIDLVSQPANLQDYLADDANVGPTSTHAISPSTELNCDARNGVRWNRSDTLRVMSPVIMTTSASASKGINDLFGYPRTVPRR